LFELARTKVAVGARETSDTTARASRAHVSLASYQAIDDLETETMRQADALMARLQNALLNAERKANWTHSPRGGSFGSLWS
jgi:hypothetical protein